MAIKTEVIKSKDFNPKKVGGQFDTALGFFSKMYPLKRG